MASLEVWCEGETKHHQHLPWGVRWEQGWRFATADECEYPSELCDAIAKRAAEHCYVRPPENLHKIKQRQRRNENTLKQRTAVGRQTATKKQKPLMPEFKQIIRLRLTSKEDKASVQNLHGRTKAPLRLQQQTLPVDTKILEKVALTTMGNDGGSNEEHVLVTLGIPHSEHEFPLGALTTL